MNILEQTSKVTFADDTTRASQVRNETKGAGFRAPHHTASPEAVLGMVRRTADGAVRHQPGEMSLAAAGVLYLDDVIEFNVETLAAVGRALANGYVELDSRGDGPSFEFRTEVRCRVVATVRPCPCGMKGQEGAPLCCCTEGAMARWDKRYAEARHALLTGEVPS